MQRNIPQSSLKIFNHKSNKNNENRSQKSAKLCQFFWYTEKLNTY